MSTVSGEDKVTLRALDDAGGSLELEMPGWALAAIRDGCAVAFGGGRGEWDKSVEADGTVTRRLPLRQEDWAIVGRAAAGSSP
jgi:hypothetical protein